MKTTQETKNEITVEAWQIARFKTDHAVPKLISEEEQTWEDSIDVGENDDFHLRLLWNSNVPGSFAPESIMLAAIQAKENQGYRVKNGVALWNAGQKAIAENDMVELNRISAELWNAVHHAEKNHAHESWSYRRYENWEQYNAAVKFPPAKQADAQSLFEKMHAGWTAQIIGGALGTMIEGYTTDAIRNSFGEVRGYLRKPSTYNDDITYEIAFLNAYERYGKDLTSAQIAKEWIAIIPSGWSAEEIALKNIRWGIFPPESGRTDNPFGEWIGAQMRGAICGMVAPGDPREAARLAWMDAEVSHFSNGILGEIFNAVLVSLSFTETDIRSIVEQCVDLMPADSEYHQVVQFALDACRNHTDWESAWRLCEKKFEKYCWIHAYPNAAAEVIALWFGHGDFDETAHIISMAGQDVDCNAAQILTAVGIMCGMDKIGNEWTEPIRDELKTYLRRDRTMSIRDLAARTAHIACPERC